MGSCLFGIETSGDLCSVAVLREDQSVVKKSLDLPYGQAGHLMGLCQEVLSTAQVTWKDLTGIVINRGPGSFTGIRGGMAAAQGFSLAGDLPLLGLTSFEIYRALCGENQSLVVVLETRRQDMFAAFFKAGAMEPEFARVMNEDELSFFLASHSGGSLVTNIKPLSEKIQDALYRLLEADDVLRAWHFYHQHKPSVFSDEPYYLREPDIHGRPAS
ncbi:MAG: tRNA (adenosine(37)-N6)-threonylcarbamoyltransferase complex dimerization subunit type 1 TsaB [Alphaproteobacteria bacterium]